MKQFYPEVFVYKLDPQLGFISLNSSLNSDEVLAVAYEYTIANDTVIYKIGELSNSGVPANQNLVLKLLKGTYFTPKLSTWDLMLKNVYAIGAYQVDSKEFFLNVMYQDDKTGSSINYLPVGDIKNKVLLEVLNLDNVNSQLDPYPDGQFDFINGVTINSSNGRIFFPVLEPFGSYLKEKINNDAEAERYIFQELYDSIQSDARQIAKKNKFFLQGTYKSSSSSEIYLGAFNIPDGSVVVTAGGRKLIENQDYVVDYNLGCLI
ncbi:MAG: cell surface protein SprA [Bacteroidetes bacterium 4572_128]|nr:MAG: cell surface protein SprA [Bacteroidetes bacterium 4572_128]